MESKILMPGDRIDLYLTGKRKDGKEQEKLTSQLVDFQDDDKLKLLMPMLGNRIVLLELGMKCELFFYTFRGVYRCKTIVTERSKEEQIYMVTVQFLTGLEKFQRRQYYRLDCLIDIRCRQVTEEEKILAQKADQNDFTYETDQEICLARLNELRSSWYQATLTDISGGGARFNGTVQHNKEDTVLIDISLELKKMIYSYKLKARIISSKPISGRTDLFENRSEFFDITMNQRETIIKFVFEEERKRRKRERGLI